MKLKNMKSSNKKPIPVYWWDKKKNFGDLIGPWLVEKITGRPPFNIRNEQSSPLTEGLATVGSLIHSLDRPNMHIWGSGSICALTEKHINALVDKKPKAIHALRGYKTYQQLTSKLGWEAPMVFGDPALLAPKFYSPNAHPSSVSKITLVPHYSHKKYFKKINDSALHIVDVHDEPESVIDQISSSSACITTSLHGIIIAQAYEVPWIWLRINGEKLLGGDFKFEDFFTVLSRDSVRTVTVDPETINSDRMKEVAMFSYLPKAKFSFDGVLNSFPNV
jgi:pyruvyltransferase